MTGVQLARVLAAVVVLAGLDVAGTIALKEAALRRAPGLALLGVGLFVVLAVVLYLAVGLAELTWVSLGWIVAVQMAVVAVDRLWYGVTYGPVQAGALLVALVALGVAALAPAPAPQPTHGDDRVPAPRHAVEP